MYHSANVICHKCNAGKIFVQLISDDPKRIFNWSYGKCDNCSYQLLEDEKENYNTLMYNTKFNFGPITYSSLLEEKKIEKAMKEIMSEFGIRLTYIDLYKLLTNKSKLREISSKLNLKVFW